MPQTDAERIARLEERLDALCERCDHFVTQDAFVPVRMIAFGLMGLVGTGFFLAAAAFVFDGRSQ